MTDRMDIAQSRDYLKKKSRELKVLSYKNQTKLRSLLYAVGRD